MSKEKPTQEVEALFTFQQLTLKKAAWTIKLAVHKAFDHVFKTYEVTFTLNRQPFEDSIKSRQGKLQSIEAEKSLFEDTYKANVKAAKEVLEEGKKNLRDAEKQYKDIVFNGLVEKVEHKAGGVVVLTMNVRSDDVMAIDQQRYALMPLNEDDKPIYKVNLKHFE